MFKYSTKLTEVIKLFIEESSPSKSLQHQIHQHFLDKLGIKAAFKLWEQTNRLMFYGHYSSPICKISSKKAQHMHHFILIHAMHLAKN
jgi:hypothetical protein